MAANYKLTIDSNFGCCIIKDINNNSTITKVERKIDGLEYQILWEASSDIPSLSEFKDYSCDIFTKYSYRITAGINTEILETEKEIILDLKKFNR